VKPKDWIATPPKKAARHDVFEYVPPAVPPDENKSFFCFFFVHKKEDSFLSNPRHPERQHRLHHRGRKPCQAERLMHRHPLCAL
jgi:hypothetical protein